MWVIIISRDHFIGSSEQKPLRRRVCEGWFKLFVQQAIYLMDRYGCRLKKGFMGGDGLSFNLINVSTSARFTIIVVSRWYGKKVQICIPSRWLAGRGWEEVKMEWDERIECSISFLHRIFIAEAKWTEERSRSQRAEGTQLVISNNTVLAEVY